MSSHAVRNVRQCLWTSSPSRHLRALSSSQLLPTIACPRSYWQSSLLVHLRRWKRAKEQGSHTDSHHADTRDTDALMLKPLDVTGIPVSAGARKELMDNFLARVNSLDPAPAQYSLRWWLRILYEVKPRRCITLVVPDEDSRDAALEALSKACQRWHGSVGALRSSYVCIVKLRKTFDDLREDLQYNSELNFKGDVLVHCAIDSRYEMGAISASPGLKTHIEASEHNEGEQCRLVLRVDAKLPKGITVDDHTVEKREHPSETTTTSPNTDSLDSYSTSLDWFLTGVACSAVVIAAAICWKHVVPKATCGCDGLRGGSEREQDQQHGESHNRGKSKQTSALDVQHGAIQATGDVDASTHIHHGCEANPLSSSSPTVGNNQPNGNEGLTQKQ